MVTDLRTRRLASLKKESFEEVLKTAGIPGRYFYRGSFATWDVLLPSEVIAKKLATNNITTFIYSLNYSEDKDVLRSPYVTVVVMPQTILPRRNRRCALSATDTRKPEEEKDARGVTYFMEENVISPREVARFNEHLRN